MCCIAMSAYVSVLCVCVASTPTHLSNDDPNEPHNPLSDMEDDDAQDTTPRMQRSLSHEDAGGTEEHETEDEEDVETKQAEQEYEVNQDALT